ncbi:glycosyltransferase family 4 protein [Oleiharenicola sp. Vm1]|uniref:glycosyltransferase family 4 protein n=1 Tax=Oleiharenicola sp. Vm1 TaxID=3398393 RepID=UPI0039F5E8E2
MTLTAPAGHSRAVVEVCTMTEGWVPLTEVSLSVPAVDVSAVAAEPRKLYPHEFARALRFMLQRPGDAPMERVAAALVASLPHPNVVRYAPLPFHGHLHQPCLLERAVFGRLIVEGWLFHESMPVRRVAASVDLQAWSFLDYGAELPYVAELFPQWPAARASRLHGFVDVSASLPQPLTLRVYAELADGTWHLCHVQRNHVLDGESAKLPYGPFRVGRFVAAVRALRRACAAHGLRAPLDRGGWRALREVWAEYRARADRNTCRPDAAPAPLVAAAPLPRRITLVTHNLNYEGAPLFLLEYATYLAARGVELNTISAAEGPLRERFAALGARVHVVDLRPLQQSATLRQWRAALARLGAAFDWGRTDLVVANTLSAHWGIHLAHRTGRPSLFYIHESTTPEVFYHGHLAPALLPAVQESFARASHVSFLTDSTRRYYRSVLTRANHSLNSGWIDLGKLNRFRAEHSRATLRARLGLDPAARLVINLGTVCDRKGQHLFARAVDLLWRARPDVAATAQFLIVGGRHTAFDRHLNDILAQLRRDNLRVIAETATPYDYFGAADLFACSSYEESFPRVVLEAMGFALPIISTAVHGVPEMVRADQEALLVPPGDPAALARALAALLVDPARGHALGAAAVRRVTAEFDATLLLPRHASLAARVAATR